MAKKGPSVEVASVKSLPESPKQPPAPEPPKPMKEPYSGMNHSMTAPRSSNPIELLQQLQKFTSIFHVFDVGEKCKVSIESLLMVLHCKITSFILLTGTLLLSMRQYFGDPIECLNSVGPSIPKSLIKQYCWLGGIFSVVPRDVNQPNVKLENVYHKFYQWVYFILMIQGVLFYLPRYIWKKMENGRICHLLEKLTKRHVEEYPEIERSHITQEVVDTLEIGSELYFWYCFSDFACLVHLLLEIWFTDKLLNGEFVHLGSNWLSSFNTEKLQLRAPMRIGNNQNDFMARIFPRLAKCSFPLVGSSGTQEIIDSLCLLPLNTINEKLFLVLWFWYTFLVVFVVVVLILRFIATFSYIFRFFLLKLRAASCELKIIRCLSSSPGKWFVSMCFAEYMRPSHFRDLIQLVRSDHFDTGGKPIYKKYVPSQKRNGHGGVIADDCATRYAYRAKTIAEFDKQEKKNKSNSRKNEREGHPQSLKSKQRNTSFFDFQDWHDVEKGPSVPEYSKSRDYFDEMSDPYQPCEYDK